MAPDLYSRLGRCTYCGHPGVRLWDTDLLSCRNETCQSLAFAEARRRHGNAGPAADGAESDRGRSALFHLYRRARA
jgi:hypothetical protein